MKKKRKLISAVDWTLDMAVDRVIFKSIDMGKVPSADDYTEKDLPSIHALFKKFDISYNELIKLAGLEPNLEPRVWTKKLVIDKFTQLAKSGEVKPTGSSIDQCKDLPNTAVIYRYFGSLFDFYNACGIDVIKMKASWYQWQWCCYQIALEKYKYDEIITQSLDTHVSGRPDLILPRRKLIIDAMQSDYQSIQKDKEIHNYSKGYALEFWCLYKYGRKYPGIKYRYSQELLKVKGIRKVIKNIVNELQDKFYSESFRDELLEILRKVTEELGRPPRAKHLGSKTSPPN